MKKLQSFMIMAVIVSVILMTGPGTLCGGAASTTYREGGLSGGQETAAVKGNTANEARSTFSPVKTKEKSEALAESESNPLPVPMERYKPYREGEGESKAR